MSRSCGGEHPDQRTQKLWELAQEQSEVVVGGGETALMRSPSRPFRWFAIHNAMLGLELTAYGVDGGSAPHLASDGGRDVRTWREIQMQNFC